MRFILKENLSGKVKSHTKRIETCTGLFISTGTDFFLEVIFPIIFPPGNIPKEHLPKQGLFTQESS